MIAEEDDEDEDCRWERTAAGLEREISNGDEDAATVSPPDSDTSGAVVARPKSTRAPFNEGGTDEDDEDEEDGDESEEGQMYSSQLKLNR